MFKQLIGWAMTGFRPKCDTCGKTLEVKRIDFGGTLFRCEDSDNEVHKRQLEIHKKWIDKVQALQVEIDAEDAKLMPNFARQNYGKIKIQVTRKAD